MSNISDIALKSEWYGPSGVLSFREKTYGPVKGVSLWRSCPMLAILQHPQIAQVYFDDFHDFPTGKYSLVEDAGAGGTDEVIDRAGGWYKQYCDGDDNDEAYLLLPGESWLFAANKPLWFEAQIQLTEANTDDANWIVGLMDSAAANALQDNGAGPPASYDGAVWFKVDGTMQCQFETSNAAAQVTTATGLAAWVSATTFRLGFVFDPLDGTTGSITPYVAGVAGTAHSITLAGLAEMELMWGVKAGDDNEEAIEIDYIKCVQIR